MFLKSLILKGENVLKVTTIADQHLQELHTHMFTYTGKRDRLYAPVNKLFTRLIRTDELIESYAFHSKAKKKKNRSMMLCRHDHARNLSQFPSSAKSELHKLKVDKIYLKLHLLF